MKRHTWRDAGKIVGNVWYYPHGRPDVDYPRAILERRSKFIHGLIGLFGGGS